MQYIIDGHNLIPKLGWTLGSMDVEMRLIASLQEFCRIRRAHVEVFFDGAPPGQAGTRSFGSVSAHFIAKASSADAGIEQRLSRLGRTVKNWVVVSSDQRVLRAARSVHAGVLSAEEFSQLLSSAQAQGSLLVKDEATILPEEVEHWLREFRTRR